MFPLTLPSMFYSMNILNILCKDGFTKKDLAYDLKHAFVQYIVEKAPGFITEVKIHVAKVYCQTCRDWTVFDPCPVCNGARVLKSKSYYAFMFHVGMMIYKWHIPMDTFQRPPFVADDPAEYTHREFPSLPIGDLESKFHMLNIWVGLWLRKVDRKKLPQLSIFKDSTK